MARQKKRNFTDRKRPGKSRVAKRLPTGEQTLVSGFDEETKNRQVEFIIIAVLLVFGIYLSVLYFAHQVVPNSDFPGFVRVGQSLLSFEIPGSFKRAPVLGILQVGLSKLVGGQHPALTAGWLLNAILYPISVILLYLIGKEFIGTSAKYFALIAAINPWSIAMLVQPLAETTLVFFILLTVYFMLKRSGWCYVFASVATMVRYEGAALIAAAFVLDMIESTNSRQRLKAFLYSALATIPLVLWIAGMVLIRNNTSGGTGGLGGMHYIRNYGHGTVFGEYFENLWQVTFRPLFAFMGEGSLKDLGLASKVFAVVGIASGVCYAVVKRQWKLIALVIFFVLFVMVHSFKSSTRSRYCMPIAWVSLLLCWYGLRSMLSLLNGSVKPPKWVTMAFGVVIFAALAVWFISLVPHLGKLTPFSRRSVSLPYIAIAAVVLILGAKIYIYRTRFLLGSLSMSAMICLMVVSNQFALARYVGNGELDAEFKMLADWYVANAEPGEKMLTTLPSTVKIFAPKYEKYFINPRNIKADTPQEFAAACQKRDVAYIAWDSRIGLTPKNVYYRRWKMERIGILIEQKDIGPYEFLGQIKLNDRRFINIFRVRKLPDASEE